VVSLIGRSATLLVVLLLLPLLVGDFWAFQLGLYFLYAIAALGVGICWGQAGFLPLGQAMFVGLSAYMSGFALLHFVDTNAWVVFLFLAAIIPGVLAYFIGSIVFRARTESGPYFALITLALCLLTYQIANSWYDVTGGFNGLKGIPSLPGMGDYEVAYYVSAAALAVALGVTAWLINAPIGVLWRGLAENERRIAFFGFDTAKLKAIAFGASGILAGIAGVIYAPQQGIVSPELCGFMFSADLVIWTAVGGRSSLLGPIIGTVLIGALASELREKLSYWELIVAGVFIVVVLYAPDGLAGLLSPLNKLLNGRQRFSSPIRVRQRQLSNEPPVLQIEEISAAIGDVQVLDVLSFSIDRPGIYCIIGPNGAGKTSVFNLLTGELSSQRGQVRLDVETVTGLSPYCMALKGVGRKFQIPSVFRSLSIGDNLRIALWCGRSTTFSLLRPSLRRWSSPILEELVGRFSFLRDQKRSASDLSHGEAQILELVMALISEPRLLLLDEPCAGLSPEEAAEVIDAIRWAGQKLILRIVIIEHDMALVKELADHVLVLHQGRLLAEGKVAEIQNNERVQEVYVGVSK
jgi:branched-chain amino acid transport system permease protein